MLRQKVSWNSFSTHIHNHFYLYSTEFAKPSATLKTREMQIRPARTTIQYRSPEFHDRPFGPKPEAHGTWVDILKFLVNSQGHVSRIFFFVLISQFDCVPNRSMCLHSKTGNATERFTIPLTIQQSLMPLTEKSFEPMKNSHRTNSVASNFFTQASSAIFTSSQAQPDGSIHFEMRPVLPGTYYIMVQWFKAGWAYALGFIEVNLLDEVSPQVDAIWYWIYWCGYPSRVNVEKSWSLE